MSCACGPTMFGKLLFQRLDHVARLIQRERRLRQIGHLVRVRHHQRLDLFDRRDNLGYRRSFALRAFHLFVVAMPHQHQRIALLGKLDRFDMHLGHQRAGGIDHLQAALLGAFANRRRNAMRGINDASAFGNLIQFVDEDRALFGQVGYDIAVVHNLFADIDRRAKGLQRNPNDVDRTHDPSAEAAGLEKENSLGFGSAALINRSMVKSGCSHAYQYTASGSDLERN